MNMEVKRDTKNKFKQKRGREEKAPNESESAEDGQFEQRMNGEVHKKKKVKEKLRSHGTFKVSKKTEGSALDGKEKKKKKEEFRSHGSDSTTMVTQDMDESEADMVEKKNNKRKGVVDGEDLGKKEKKIKRMSKGNSDVLDKNILDEEMIDLFHHNLKRKKKGTKSKDPDAIELEGSKDENRDNKLQQREEDKYGTRKKKDKNRISGYIEKEINDKESREENMMKEEKDKQTNEGSKRNKRDKKASKSEEKDKSVNKVKQKEATTANNEANGGKKRKERKQVHFSDEVEVFSAPSDSEQKSRHKEMGKGDELEGLVWGKRFTKEEDMTLLKAIDDYIQAKQLGENGREMLYYCKKHKELTGCWTAITACLPHRPYDAVYFRGRVLLRKNATQWTPEDYENLKQFQATHGNNWKLFGDLYSKNCRSVKDVWRALKYAKLNTGHWNQEEYQTLFDLVNLDLKLKAFTKEPETHAVLRDNISWEAISGKLETRRQTSCCQKWYSQLTSSLVRDNLWADTDDYRLIVAVINSLPDPADVLIRYDPLIKSVKEYEPVRLQKVDASCIEEVDWDIILPHREGDVCQKRWLQMVRYIGEHKQRSFVEQADILASRYCPEMLEYRTKDDEQLV